MDKPKPGGAGGGGPKGCKAGPGRKKGIPNKQTTAIKEMIIAALEGVGGQKYLMRQASENPVAFMTLVGKVLPMQLTGEGGGPVLAIIERRIIK